MFTKDDTQKAREAGKRGAATVKERLGNDHFVRMGRVGGAVTKAKMGLKHYSTIGKVGGARRWAKVKAEADEPDV